MVRILFVFAALMTLAACSPKVVERVEGKHFGETISESKAMSYEQLLAELEKKGGLENVKVEGKVQGVCQTKGCWMTIVSEKENAEAMFVKFKDYGFFMPMDLAGRTVVMHGNAYREVTSVEELRHYAEDNGESEEAIKKITEPKVELKFLADGVVIK